MAGLFPAIHSSLQRENLASTATSRSTTGRVFWRVQCGLAVAQMALGLGLLTAAGLFVHSLYLLNSVNPGFVHQGVIDFQVLVPNAVKPAEVSVKLQNLLEQFRAIPGVTGAGYITVLPPELLQGVWGPFLIGESATMKNTENPMFANSLIASEGYFGMMGISVIQGREFTPSDTAASPAVMVVNQSLARKFFPNGNALGSHVRVMYDEGGSAREIVGIVKDAHDRGLGAPAVPTAYVPLKQFAMGYGGMLVRSVLPPQQLISLIRERAARVDSSIPLTNFQTPS